MDIFQQLGPTRCR